MAGISLSEITAEQLDSLNDVYTEDLFTDDNGQYFTALAEDLATSDNNGLILSETNVSFITAQFDELYNDYYLSLIHI